MSQFTVRGTSADLPVFEEDADLEPVSSLGTGAGLVSGFEFAAASLPALDLEDVRLQSGKIRAVRAEQASITGARIDSVEFTGCELASLRWTAGKISRVRFDSCKLVGARFEGVTLDHVVFTGCKLDYATLDQIRATGPVLFARCSLREAEFNGCDLAHSLFDDCDLHLTGFGSGNYRGCDLRGNDLSALVGTGNLKHIIIDRAQLMRLAEALAGELDVTFGDELNRTA